MNCTPISPGPAYTYIFILIQAFLEGKINIFPFFATNKWILENIFIVITVHQGGRIYHSSSFLVRLVSKKFDLMGTLGSASTTSLSTSSKKENGPQENVRHEVLRTRWSQLCYNFAVLRFNEDGKNKVVLRIAKSIPETLQDANLYKSVCIYII